MLSENVKKVEEENEFLKDSLNKSNTENAKLEIKLNMLADKLGKLFSSFNKSQYSYWFLLEKYSGTDETNKKFKMLAEKNDNLESELNDLRTKNEMYENKVS